MSSASVGRPAWDAGRNHTAMKSSRDRFWEGAAAGVTALIVDDDPRNTYALTALLRRGRMIVVTAPSGPAALEILEHRVDIGIVLIDIMMPVMDGYQAMAAIRRRPESAQLPIIAVTGKVVSGERQRCIAAGACDFIAKPIDTVALVTAISRWVLAATRHRPPPPRMVTGRT
jgi:CheY-like chemotaxis protein